MYQIPDSAQYLVMIHVMNRFYTHVVSSVYVKKLDDGTSGGNICCRAMTKECQACSQGITVEEFCESHPGEFECPNKIKVGTASPDKVTMYDEVNYGGRIVEFGIGEYDCDYFGDIEFHD